MTNFVSKALETLEGAEQLAMTLLNSKQLPKHFYEGEPGQQIALVITIITMGQDLGLSVSNSIRHLIPLNGIIGMKGDYAMAMILNSGELDTWLETTTGSIENGDYAVAITASRKNGLTRTEIFDVDRAKRMKLWIDPKKAMKYPTLKKSPWFKTPERMMHYRALGFIARDLFPDVLNGIYLAEEAQDIDTDNTKVLTETGMEVDITKEDQVQQVNSDVAAKINEQEQRRAELAAGAEKPELKEQPQPPNLFATAPEPPAGNMTYEQVVRSMTPRQLADEFNNAMPFSLVQWVEAGGKKEARTAMALLLANAQGIEQLKAAVAERGIHPEKLFPNG